VGPAHRFNANKIMAVRNERLIISVIGIIRAAPVGGAHL
jgi:hypothetical protein